MVSSERIRQLEQDSANGERLHAALMESGVYALLDEMVFQPLEHNAFLLFTTIAPTETENIMQAQQNYKAILRIKSRISSIIEEGRKARHELSTLPDDESDE